MRSLSRIMGSRAGWGPAPFRGFAHAESGATAMLFALSVLPLTMAVGAAVDYGSASNVKAKLDAAIDAAALETVSRSMLSESAATAKAHGVKVFKTHAAAAGRIAVNKIDLAVTDTVANRTAVASYSAQVSTAFMGIIGVPSLEIGGSSSTTSVLAPYIDFHLLLDNTPSMGVAATPADIDKMVANTSDKCAFACHETEAHATDYYTLAKKLGVTMRIDVLRKATQELTETAKSTAYGPKQFRMAIHTFGASCTALGIANVSALTSQLNQVKKDAEAVDLMTIPKQNYNNDQCTDFNGTLKALNAAVEAPGTGVSASAPQKIVFFVSDGVADAFNPTGCTRATMSGGRCQEPINVAGCKTLKDRGVKVAVLYTTYLPLPTNGHYNTWIAPFASQINPTMQSCASPGLFFEVSPTQGISEAMTALFQKAVAQARFTN